MNSQKCGEEQDGRKTRTKTGGKKSAENEPMNSMDKLEAAREDACFDEAPPRRKSYCFTHTEATINYLCNPLFSPQSVRIVHLRRRTERRGETTRGAFRKLGV